MSFIEIDSSDSEDDFGIQWPGAEDEQGSSSGRFVGSNHSSEANRREGGRGGLQLNGNGENMQRRILPPSIQARKPPLPERSAGVHGGPSSNHRMEAGRVRVNGGSEVNVINIGHGRSTNDNKVDQQIGKRTLPGSLQPPMHRSALQGPHDYRGNAGRKTGAYGYNSNEKQRLMNVAGAHLQSSSSRIPVATIEDKDDVVIYNVTGSNRALPQSFTNSKPIENSEIGELRITEHDEREIYQQALQNLGQQKLVEDDLPEGYLSVSLLKHQKTALAWMVEKESSVHCAGGILADDQGLGKTISMIALVQKQRAQQSEFTSDNSQKTKSEALNLDDDDDVKTDLDKEKQVAKDDLEKKAASCTSKKQKPAAGTLVVCPASILRQWAREIDEKVPEKSKLSVLVYHGGARTRDPAELAKYDIVLTTYAIVTNELPRRANTDDDGEQRNLDKYDISSEFASKKRKQETNGHRKGKKKGKRLDDSLLDYDSGPLARVRWFRVILDEAQTIKNHRTHVARACSGFRAKRRWCLSGTPIQNSIDDLYSYFRFLKYEPYSDYSSFCSLLKHPIARDTDKGYKKLQAVLNTVLLRRTKGTLIHGKPIINLPPKLVVEVKVDFSSEERSFYLQLEADSRQQFKKYAAAGTVRQNYASILVMLLRLRQACDHPVLVKGVISNTSGKDNLDMARQLPKELLSNLLCQLEGSLAICRICNDPPEDAVVTMCGHVFCYQCVSERLTGDDNLCPALGCKGTVGTDSVFSRATLETCICNGLDNNASTSGSTHEEELSIVQSGYVSSKIKSTLAILNSLCSPSYNIGSEEYNEEDCCMIGADVSTNPKLPIKAIVFSQWTGMLDLLEYSLNQSLIQYRRLDGSISLALRDKAVREFNTDPEVTVMLMSLKAGNLGLNMVAACHVILLDLWWNPTTEDQAVDRAHRIGQTRPVTVSRLTVKDTVEDRILALQEEKRNMVSSAFGEDPAGGRASKLTVDDLRFLFGF